MPRYLIAGVALATVGCVSAENGHSLEEVVATALEVVADSIWDHGLVVHPVMGGSAEVFRYAPPFDSLEEGYVIAGDDETGHELFRRGRQAQRNPVRLSQLDGTRIRLLTDEEVADLSAAATRNAILESAGGDVGLVTLAVPAISASGDEALVYHFHDELLPMGNSSWYVFLRKEPDGWRVEWYRRVYIE